MIRNGENMILEDIQTKKITGKEIYGIYQPDICYVNRDGIERTLQIIIPETAQDSNKKYPVILHVQGSAWKKQDVYKRVGVMEDFTKKGFVTAILQYRESEIAPFPAPVEDAKTGIRFLRKNAERFNIDPGNIFLMGDSSGGNTAFITAFTADMDCMDTEVYKEYSCKVNAVVDLYGVSCVKIKEDFPTTPNQGEPDSPEGLEIGGKNVYEHPELSDQITCMNYVKKELPSPPVLMIHGAADDTVAPNQSIQLYKKLKEEDKDVTFYLVEGADHGHPYFWSEPTLSLIEQFFRKHMK